ncbi:UDP-N-acetylmuramoylalanyl-D-glutamate--2,6-diaminopimelate ligase [Alkalihalobacillus alcalophilus ATCC 27647 = CGMCC 1.3604]|uniref:UDP-N-acetylmuramoyl-L-alanyl-D-glutamate--2,6-diaminopimelate ligase n=2 Tax=Alkalihalobacillus alcalophilus ATCC 27647 = CGMCC 1.3604 TaxID=1218173 RepID=A0A4S4JYY5_ALKAL|nr:UDP-N-acetylmuramoylalanyl-D-glutamate--2,6-diaminopimelate ligase [Alkalihalobacillus alcalophilus ATCC 27647 = CGMCC 1.3604]
MMKLSELMNVIPFLEIDLKADPLIEKVEMDNREVSANTLFICINGYTVDGHDFAESAVERGAVAVLAERPLALDVPVIVVSDTKRMMARIANHFYDYPTKKFNLIGVTGTNGKTSTTLILEHIFKEAKKTTGVIGTMYAKVGEEIVKTKNTTPESLTLQQTFHKMVEANVETAFMEVSSHALDYGRVHGCDFNVAVFTNLTPDHLDYHQTMEAYLFAKGLLFAQLGNAYENKFAILNADDPASKKLMKMTSANLLTYGIDNEASITAQNIRLSAKGTSFDLFIFNQSYAIDVSLIGKFNVYNLLAAVASSYVSGLPIETIVRSLATVKGISGRFETVRASEKQDFTVVVDYAHTSDSLKNVLETVNELAPSDIKVVVGCGGDRDRTKRPVMAQIATKFATEAIFTSDNPRSEDPKQILIDMTSSLKDTNYQVIVDRKEAIEQAIASAKKGDIIVIAGKGHETYQQFADKTIHFDDREVAFDAIKERI